jgi:hypothetical protein
MTTIHFGDVASVTGRLDRAAAVTARAAGGVHAVHASDRGVLRSLANLEPKTLAVMHGSSYVGRGGRLLTELAGVIRESFDV